MISFPEAGFVYCGSSLLLRDPSMAKNQHPIFSFVLPTRSRPDSLRRLFDSFKATTTNLQSIEVVLVVAEDDQESLGFTYEDVPIKRLIVKPGLNMGALNMAAYHESSGQYIMILNDDVTIKTRGWDEKILSYFKSFPDGILLVHVNDLIFKEKLCTFPFVSRVFCNIAGGICPSGYYRHRIDDHIYNIFNLLGVLGRKRILYLPNVIFEHHHYAISKLGKRKYKLNDKIEESDAKLFDKLLPDRKKIALKLMEYIDRFSQRDNVENRRGCLEVIRDSFSIRTPEYIYVRPDDFTPNSSNTRVTIGVVTANSESELYNRCIKSIKKFTTNYDLILLDNNSGPCFSHPREMNKIMDITRTDYLVLMDDDVFVEWGWLNGLFQCIKPEVGVVTPLHKDRNGDLSYSGIVFKPNESGDHGHIFSLPRDPCPTITLCSALLLIDMNKCGHIRFNENYTKYFHDIDYGLRIWEAGFQVICSPHTMVTHLAGGTLAHGSGLANKLFEEQRQEFEREWFLTTRFSMLEKDIFQRVQELQKQLKLSSQVKNLLTRPPAKSLNAFRAHATHLFNKLEPYQVLKKFIWDNICADLGKDFPNAGHEEKGHLIFLLGLCGHPVLIEQNYCGFNILFCHKTYYAIPETERVFDLDRIHRSDYFPFYMSEDLEDVKNQIDRNVAKGFIPKTPGFMQRIKFFLQLQFTHLQVILRILAWFSNKLLLRVVREIRTFSLRQQAIGLFRLHYNLVHIAMRNFGWKLKEERNKTSEGSPSPELRQRDKTFLQLLYERFRSALFLAERRRWVIKTKPIASNNSDRSQVNAKWRIVRENDRAAVIVEQNYEGFVILQDLKGFYAFSIDEWNGDPAAGEASFSAKSVEGIRRLIYEGVPRLVDQNYKGFAIYGFEHYFFAINPPERSFSLEDLRKGAYKRYALAHTITEVKDAVDNLFEEQTPSEQTKSLIFSSLPRIDMEML